MNLEKFDPIVDFIGFPSLKYQDRVLRFNPKLIMEQINIKHTERKQKIQNILLFPSQNNKCSCGCDTILPPRHRRWAKNDCMLFARDVGLILYGKTPLIKTYLSFVLKNECARCKTKKVKLYLDHIIPVKKGGGSCWLSNYQYLCFKCHVIKTKEDFQK
jgi:hypothetical protein